MGCCCPDREERYDVSSERPFGLERQRRCTDIPMFVVYTCFLVGLVAIAGYAYAFGNICGSNNSAVSSGALTGKDMTRKPYLFFLDPSLNSQLTICVESCPLVELEGNKDLLQFYSDTGVSLCLYNVTADSLQAVGQRRTDGCPFGDPAVPATFPFMNRCVPQNLKEWAQNILATINRLDLFQRSVSAIVNNPRYILFSLAVSIALTLLMLVVLSCLTSSLVYGVTVLALLGSAILTAFLWWAYVGLKLRLDSATRTRVPLLSNYIDNEWAFFILAIISSVFLVLLLVIVCVMWKRLRFVVGLFGEASRCLRSLPTLFLQPVITLVFLLAFLAGWTLALALLSTCNRRQLQTDGTVEWQYNSPVRYLWWYLVFGLFWTVEVILAGQEYTVAASVAHWYFDRKKGLGCVTGGAMCRTLRYHLGTIAFGGLVLTLVKLPRKFLLYLRAKSRATENSCVKCCLNCLSCCFWCLEKCVKYLDRNAYVVSAVTGSSFCTSARKAFLTLTSNALRVAAINSVGDFVLFLTKILIAAGTAATCVALFKVNAIMLGLEPLVNITTLPSNTTAQVLAQEINDSADYFYLVPVLLVGLFGLLIGHVFVSVFEMVVDALLICFCEDCVQNDQLPAEQRQYYMSDELRRLMEVGSDGLGRKSHRGLHTVVDEGGTPLKDSHNDV